MLLEACGPRIFGTEDDIMSPSSFDDGRYFVVWHCLWALLAAVFGGAFAVTVRGTMAKTRLENCGDSKAAARFAQNRRLAQAGFWSVGIALAMTICFGSTLLNPELWAGLTFLLTGLLFELLALRALLSQGKRRDGTLAASILGMSFLILVFGRTSGDPWPMAFPTVGLLDDLRPTRPLPGSPTPAGGTRPQGRTLQLSLSSSDRSS